MSGPPAVPQRRLQTAQFELPGGEPLSAQKTSDHGAARFVHEVFFSLNLGLSLTVLIVFELPYLFDWDLHMIEFTALKSLHVHLSEYGGGRWCFFPLMAICTWLLLRLFPDKRLALEILRSAAGWLAVGAAPLWWLGRFGTDWDHFSMLFGQVGFYELIVTFWCIALYLTHRWPVPSWAGLLLLSGHYTY